MHILAQRRWQSLLSPVLSLFIITIYQQGGLFFFPEHSRMRKIAFTYRASA